MKNPTDKLKTILRDLAKITDVERSAIARRAFDQIAELTSQKETLLAEFDEIASVLGNGELSEQLINELETIRIRADENAAILKATVQGVREARNRLKKLREADFNTGAYRADGGALRNPNASTVTAKA